MKYQYYESCNYDSNCKNPQVEEEEQEETCGRGLFWMPAFKIKYPIEETIL